MVEFNRVGSSRLYQLAGPAPASGWWGFVLPGTVTPPAAPIPLKQALASTELRGSFVYLLGAPDVGDESFVKALVMRVDALAGGTAEGRAIVWLTTMKPAEALADRTPVLALAANGSTTVALMTWDLSGVKRLLLTVPAGTGVSAGDSALTLTNPNYSPIQFSGPAAPDDAAVDPEATLGFEGETLGAICVGLSLRRNSLSEKLNWGFQFLTPNTTPPRSGTPYLTVWMPLASGIEPSPTDAIRFSARLNPADPNNLAGPDTLLRTQLRFTGRNTSGAPTVLVSSYRTLGGDPLVLQPIVEPAPDGQPAALVVNPGAAFSERQAGFRFGPVGDFALSVEDKADASGALLCGLAGGETLEFVTQAEGVRAGDRLRFSAMRPAYAPVFPIPPASPIGPPFDASARLLDETFRTSWATVVAGSDSPGSPHYAASPQGADPFGRDSIVAPRTRLLLGPVDPGVALADRSLAFPLGAYAGVQPGDPAQDLTADEVQRLERELLSPTRRARISGSASPPSSSARESRGAPSADATPYNTTTPAGLIATVDAGRFTRLLLAQLSPPGGGEPDRQVCFLDLKPELQAAFQTSDLMLVAANAESLGAFTDVHGAPKPDGAPRFCNVVSFADWTFTANVGRNPGYGDYRNVMLVKGVRGRLVDLVTSPDRWTQKDRFAAPTTLTSEAALTPPDPGQLLPLSSWLVDYFARALEHGDDPYFARFNRIIQDEAWTGILLLKVDLTQIPHDLVGLLAGVDDPSAFFAHHVGIEIGQVDREKIDLVASSSLFGLIYYVDRRFDVLREQPIPPSDLGATYDFTLLTLQVLFENTAVQRFHSVAQAVLNRILGTRVDHMQGEGANIYNALLLRGAYQRNGDAPVYSLASSGTTTFELANDVLLRAVVEGAQLTTRDDGARSGRAVSWLAMSGTLGFARLKTDDGLSPFDLYSFGADEPEGAGGLAYGHLGLEISFPVAEPAQRQLLLQTGELTFDAATSRVRQDSLFQSFQLELQGLVQGGGESTPAKLGYLTLGTPQRPLSGVGSQPWHGLVYAVNLGTPGALAGKLNLTATLLTAWADDSGADGSAGTQAVVGLRLPGAGGGAELLSLQTVLSVSVGTPRLFFNAEKQSFLLVLSELALKFLGLLKVPPNGSTSFFLFGDRNVKDTTGLGWLAVYNQDPPKA